MATASVTNNFVNGTTADADDVDTNFTDLVTFLNNSVLHLDGSKAMTGDLDVGSNKVTNLAAPTVSTDAARKSEVDAKADSSHTHGDADIDGLDASAITTGTMDVDRLPDASLSSQGVVELSNILSSTSTTKAATANVAKTLNDSIDDVDAKLVIAGVEPSGSPAFGVIWCSDASISGSAGIWQWNGVSWIRHV